MRAQLLFALLAGSVPGCSPDGTAALYVDVRTDLRAGGSMPEIDRACAEISPAGAAFDGGPIANCVALDDGSTLLDGERVAEAERLTPGEYEVRVYVERAGAIVLDATIRTALRESTVVTVPLSRLCGAPGQPQIMCPRPGDDPSLTLCVDGGCADPRCTPEHPEFCPTPPPAGCDGGTGVWHVDCDGDSYASPGAVSQMSCVAPPLTDCGGWTERVPAIGTVDCDDARRDVAPDQPEGCDGVDNDCDGVIDEGLTTNRCGTCGPEPAEVCDGVDNDCNGITDEGFTCAAGSVRSDAVCNLSSCERTCTASCTWPSACTPPLPSTWPANNPNVSHACGSACYTNGWCGGTTACEWIAMSPAPLGIRLPPGRWRFTVTLWAEVAGTVFDVHVVKVVSGGAVVTQTITRTLAYPTTVFPGSPHTLELDVPPTTVPCDESYAMVLHLLGGSPGASAIQEFTLDGPRSIEWPVP